MSEDVTLDEFAKSDGKEPSEFVDEGLREEGFLTLPHDWDISTVREVSKEGGLVDGDWIESADMDESGAIQLVQLGHIGEGRFKGKPNRFITKEFAEQEDCTVLSEGDLLISRMQEPILRSCILPSFEQDSVMAVDIARLQEDENWNRMLLKYIFNSRPIWKQGIAWASGTTRKRISRKNIEKLRLPTPPLSEQRKIATILHTVDQATQKTGEIIDQTRQLKKGLHQSLFRNWSGITTSDPLAGEYPAEWELMELSEVVDVTDAEHFTPDYTNSGTPVLRPGDLTPGRISLDNVEKRVDEETYKELTRRHTPSNKDIVYSRSQNFAVASQVIEDRRYCLGQDTVVIQSNKLNPTFLLHLLNSPVVESQAIRRSTGSTFSRVNLGDIRSFKIPIPSEDIQQQIATRMSEIEERLRIENQYLNQLQRFKRGLMQDLLSGEVRTTDVNIDVPQEVAKYA